MNEQALSMEEPKQKLAHLEEHLPDAPNELVYDFGRYLAEYLNQSLVPMGFVMGCTLAIHDLQTGTNGFTGKPIQNRLVGYPPAIYGFLQMEIPRIATAVFPAEFAEQVKTHVEAVNAKMRKERAAT